MITRTNHDAPGLTRSCVDGVVEYRDGDGSVVNDLSTLERIRALHIPPAWTQIWISPDETGHLQALGTDAAGKRQYVYHRAWSEHESKIKFDRALDLAETLPRAREEVDAHLHLNRPTKERALAAAFRMLDTGSLRVGSERYAQDHGSFGLSTLLGKHAVVRGDTVHLTFPAKSHHSWESDIVDSRLARVISGLKRRGQDLTLLAYPAKSGWIALHADHINGYVKERTGGHFTAKDFRTLHGTLAAARSLTQSGPVLDETDRARAIARSMRAAAAVLENTPAVAKASYVDPRLIDIYVGAGRIDISLDSGAETELSTLLRSASMKHG